MSPRLRRDLSAWRDALLIALFLLLLQGVLDPAHAAAPSHRVVERTMEQNATPEFKRDEESTRDLLSLVGITVPLETIEAWSDNEIEQVLDYAGALHFKASDNDIQVPTVPMVLGPYVYSEVMNYDPNLVLSGRMAEQTVVLTFADWKYRAQMTVTVGGNCRGLSIIEAAVDKAYDQLCGPDGNGVLHMFDKAGNELLDDDLSADVNWLQDKLIKAEIVAIKAEVAA